MDIPGAVAADLFMKSMPDISNLFSSHPSKPINDLY